MAAHQAMANTTTSAPAAVIAGSGAAGTSGGRISVSASGGTVGHITITPGGSGFHPGSVNSAVGPAFQMTTLRTGSNTGGSTSTTTPSPTTPTGRLPGHLLLGPDGQPVAIVFGADSASSGSASTTTDATTTPSPTTPTGHLPGHLLLGPDGQPVAIVF